MNAIELSILAHRLSGICNEMGAALRRTALSPNIKDREDYSCALFDGHGQLVAQAAHIPVHLGSMAYAMRSIVDRFTWRPGDVVVFNDPFLGGTHLPDVTLVVPVFAHARLQGFAAARAHHADIGVVGAGGGEALQAGMREHRHHQGHIGQVRAAEEGIVEHDDVAGAPGEAVDDGAHGIGHRAQVHGDMRSLRHELAMAIEQGAGIVLPILDVRGQGGAPERRPHLVADAGQAVGEDAELDGVHACASSSRCPASATDSAQPGASQVVAVGSMMMAGPTRP